MLGHCFFAGIGGGNFSAVLINQQRQLNRYNNRHIITIETIPSLILDLLGIADRGTGISIWLIAVILSSAVLILALYLLERHYRRVGEKYDSALSQYKTREEAIPAE